MLDNNLVHPGAEQLGAFGLGQLAPPEAAEIERHVTSCTVCCQTLWSLPDDRLVSLLRQSFSRPPAVEATSAFPGAVAQGPQLPPELAEHPRYRIVEVLGQGGMGTVYKAQHRLMERLVALKVIDRGLTGKPAVVERFRREVKAAAQLNHPNIVHAYDAEQAGDSHFLVMEFVEGTTLARLVEQQGPLPVAQACDYVRQAALGLQRAFEHGMVHRDIKPHNLMRTPQGVIKILDFGLARLISETSAPSPLAKDVDREDAAPVNLTQVGMVMGTADYMAPEQGENAHTADIRSDIYSLGCTLYYLLIGEAPFPEGTTLDKLSAHRIRKPQPLSDIRKDVSPGLLSVVERMMAKDPAQRYQTPAELAEALRPFITAPRRTRTSGYLAALPILAGALMIAVVIFIRTDKGDLVLEPDVRHPQSRVTELPRTFSVRDKPITQDGVSVDTGSWRIEAKEPRTIRLFEIANPNVEECRVIYQAQLKCEELQGKAYLEMLGCSPDWGEAFSKDLLHPLSRTTDWASYETPFFLKKGERLDLIKLNVVIEGKGTVWIKDVSLRKAPLPQ